MAGILRGLSRKKGLHVCCAHSAPLKICTSAALTERDYFCEEWAVLVYLSVVEFTIFETPSLKVKFSTKLDSISLWNVFSVGMEQFSVFFTVLQFPFLIYSRVSNPISSVVSTLTSIVVVFVLIVFAFF